MKKILLRIAIFVISIILTLLSGCNSKLSSPQNPLGDKGLAGKQKAEEVMENLQTGDAESLKAMFCNELKAGDNFDEKISEVISFIDGKIISYDIGGGSGGKGKSWEELSPHIYNIKTDKNKYYTIFLSIYIENKDENKLGIHDLNIWLEDESEDTKNGVRNSNNNVCIYTE